MKRILSGLVLAVHGLAHALPGAQAGAAAESWLLGAPGLDPSVVRWCVALLSATAMTGLLAGGLGVWGLTPFRRHWRGSTLVGSAASAALIGLFWLNGFGLVGLVLDLAVIVVLGLGPFGISRTDGPGHDGHKNPGTTLKALNAGVVAFAAWLFIVSATAPAHRFWGSTPAELELPLPGDEPMSGPPTYWLQHAVTIDAPAEEVWPWLAQLGTDKGGFYSYAFLERAFGIDVHNADRIHPEWQDMRTGGFVLAAPKGYLGFDHPLGWTVQLVVPGRVVVLQNWGAFVLQPVGDSATRLIVRTRDSQPASLMGLAFSSASLALFEPAHFLMERRMLLGVKDRAEARGGGAASRDNPTPRPGPS